ncbi:MAG: hypothetical protein ABIJ25_07220 [Pseudomonadota bacterium]
MNRKDQLKHRTDFREFDLERAVRIVKDVAAFTSGAIETLQGVG